MGDEEKKDVKIKEYFQVFQGERRDLGAAVTATAPPVPQPEQYLGSDRSETPIQEKRRCSTSPLEKNLSNSRIVGAR